MFIAKKLVFSIYRIYPNKRPGCLFNFFDFEAGAYSRVGANYFSTF